MAILEYPKGDTRHLSPNFRVSEFACHGRNCCDTVKIDPLLIAYLQSIRDHFGKPVTVNSGYRCPAHNAAVGGSSHSQHTAGMAADISVADIPPAEVAAYAESLGILGIGLYETQRDGFFVHIDTRLTRAFWYGQAQSPRTGFGGYGLTHFRNELQQILGVSEEKLLLSAPTLGEKWNRRHDAVKPVQRYLAALGYGEVGQADGIAGAKFAAAVAHFQQDHGCENTGILEQWGQSWHILLQIGEGGNA